MIFLIATWHIVALASNVRKIAASIVAINILLDVGFFLTHTISTPHYLMPLVLLSVWTLLFSFFNDPNGSTSALSRPAFVNVIDTGPPRVSR